MKVLKCNLSPAVAKVCSSGSYKREPKLSFCGKFKKIQSGASTSCGAFYV